MTEAASMSQADDLDRLPAEVVACYVVCNEEDHLADSMRSIKAYVDRFVVVDSVFPSNPLTDPTTGAPATHSTDSTRAVAERVCAAYPAKPLTYIESDARLTQSYARNVYLEQLRPPGLSGPGDWAFVIDGDEIMYGQHAIALKTFAEIREGVLRHSLSIPVFTVAINSNKDAPAITPDEFDTAPLISTMGYMPRLFAAASNLRYLPPPPPLEHGTPILTFISSGLQPQFHLQPANLHHKGGIFLINHHTRQSFESYQNDYIWETRL